MQLGKVKVPSYAPSVPSRQTAACSSASQLAFQGTELDFLLRNLGVTTIVGVGVSVNVAIQNLAFDAVNSSYQMVIPRDAVAGFPADYVESVFTHTLAAISTVGAFKVATTMAIGAPLLILGLPLMDTALVIFRRWRKGRPIYQADKSHLHHHLLARGFSQRQTVLILYGISLGLCVMAFAVFVTLTPQ